MSDYYKFKPGVKFTKDFDGKVLHWEDWSFNITIALVPLGLQGVMEGVEPRPSPLQAPQVFPAPPPNVGNAQDNAGGAQPQPQHAGHLQAAAPLQAALPPDHGEPPRPPACLAAFAAAATAAAAA